MCILHLALRDTAYVCLWCYQTPAVAPGTNGNQAQTLTHQLQQVACLISVVRQHENTLASCFRDIQQVDELLFDAEFGLKTMLCVLDIHKKSPNTQSPQLRPSQLDESNVNCRSESMIDTFDCSCYSIAKASEIISEVV